MSRKPGIASEMTWEIASAMLGFNLENPKSDIPVTLRHGAIEMPLGRYLRRLLRQRIGKGDVASESETKSVFEKTMRPLLEAAKKDSENPSVRSQAEILNRQYARQLAAREKFNRKKGL